MKQGEKENMNKAKISVAAIILLISSWAFAGAWTNMGKIAGTPHDLSGRNADGNGELCVYCHTPHAADSAFTGAPLWNKDTPVSDVTYRLYGETAGTKGKTIAGTLVGGTKGEVSSPSLVCLGCHDGVSAIDSILNAPGSGMNSKKGSDTIVKYMASDTFKTGGNIGAGGLAGVDLSNDHPISIQYIQGRASLKDPKSLLTGGIWKGATNIEDLLRGPAGNMVECSSCHDPHNGYSKTGSNQVNTREVNYLRMTNAGSRLCLGCHDK